MFLKKSPHRLAVLEVKRQMRNLGAQWYDFIWDEVDQLASVIYESEEIKAFMYAVYSKGYGLFVATNKRIIIIDKHFYSNFLEEFPYPAVRAIESWRGIFFGKGILYAGNQDITFNWVSKKRLQEFVNYVDERVIYTQGGIQ